MKTIDYIDVLDAFKAFDIHTKRYTEKNKEWLSWKYFHTLDVVKTGFEIIQKEKILAEMSEESHKRMERSLLFHDIARSKQMMPNGCMIPHFVHGAEGMQMLLEKGEQDISVLSSVLVHDQLTMNFLEEQEHILKQDIVFQKLPELVQKSVLTINQSYQSLSDKEKLFVRQTCFLVKDADTLSNILNYQQLLKIEKNTDIFHITPAVWKAVSERQYVSYKNVATFLDKILVYMAWTWHFYYEATIRILWQSDILNHMKEYVLFEMKHNGYTNRVVEIDVLLKELIDNIRQFHEVKVKRH